MDLHLDVQEGQFIATSPEAPGARGIGRTADQAVRRLGALVHAAEAAIPSPFATVRKRLGER